MFSGFFISIKYIQKIYTINYKKLISILKTTYLFELDEELLLLSLSEPEAEFSESESPI